MFTRFYCVATYCLLQYIMNMNNYKPKFVILENSCSVSPNLKKSIDVSYTLSSRMLKNNKKLKLECHRIKPSDSKMIFSITKKKD